MSKETTNTKFCKDCKHLIPRKYAWLDWLIQPSWCENGSIEHAKCGRSTKLKKETNVVTGITIETYDSQYCSVERQSFRSGACAKEGRFFQSIKKSKETV